MTTPAPGDRYGAPALPLAINHSTPSASAYSVTSVRPALNSYAEGKSSTRLSHAPCALSWRNRPPSKLFHGRGLSWPPAHANASCPFPGWTLPGVFGAGGLQALVKGGYSVAGKRIIVAGTGPLLLAVAFHLEQFGAKVIVIAEQAGLRSLLPFAAKLWSHPARLLQGARYRTALRKVPYRTGCWPLQAVGSDKLTAVRLTNGKHIWTEPCDLLACGFHLVPSTELAALLGCKITGDSVAVDAATRNPRSKMSTAQANPPASPVCMQHCCKVESPGCRPPGSLRKLMLSTKKETGRRPSLKTLRKPLPCEQSYVTSLSRTPSFCRCEDVRYSQLQAQPSWTDAKLLTRCGMGPCQGRICGPAVQTLFGWEQYIHPSTSLSCSLVSSVLSCNPYVAPGPHHLRRTYELVWRHARHDYTL